MPDEDRIPDLASLLTLTRIADGGSLVAAGRAVGISSSAVGKTLARLAGEPFLGVVAQFARSFPAIELDIDFSDRQVDLVAEGFDAAIRSGRVRDTCLMAKVLSSFRMELAASPDYLAMHGTPERIEDLADHRCIHFRFSHNGRLGAWPPGEREAPAFRPAVTCNNLEARLAFAIAGLGIAFLPDFATGSALREGRLVRVIEAVRETVPLTLLWPSSHHLSSKTRVFVDYMACELRRLMDSRP